MKKKYTVLIAGRENVGKSSLFNKFVDQYKAIVDDYPGVTRDRLYGTVNWIGREFRIIDTGGMLFDGQDLIKNRVIEGISAEIKEADLVMFVTDAKTGIVEEDRRIFDFIRKNSSEYIVVVNKADNEKRHESIYDFYNLGVDSVFPVSAAHSLGIDDVLDHIVSKISENSGIKSKDKNTSIAIVGKENVGKSSLFNVLVNEERSIVTEIPGTTRDSVDSVIKIKGREFDLIDTAGVKKRKRIKEKPEEYSIGRAFSNVKRADLVVHLIDAVEGLQDMDKKILGYAYEHFRAIVLVVNKWDLIEKDEQEKLRKEYSEYMKKSLKFLRFAPVVFISAKEKKGIAKFIDIVLHVEKQYNFRVKTSVLNKVFNEAIFTKAPSSKKGKLKIYYISQVSSGPPAFALFLNSKDRLHLTYLRYLENKLREAFGFEGSPIKFYIKQKEKNKDK